MLLKLAALGALGYAGYKYYDNNRDQFEDLRARLMPARRSQPQVALAGGPLSSEAEVVHPGEGPLA